MQRSVHAACDAPPQLAAAAAAVRCAMHALPLIDLLIDSAARQIEILLILALKS